MLKKAPFFILANPRSGSSLLRVICDSHSYLTVPPECGFMEWWYEKYMTWTQEDSDNSIKVDEFLTDLNSSKKFETWGLDIEIIREKINILRPSNYQELVEIIYVCFGNKRKSAIHAWGDKNNYYIHLMPKLLKIYPKAKFIHLVRDGRDVATSYLALKDLKTQSNYAPHLTSDLEEIAKEWAMNNKQISNFLVSLPKEQVFFVKYEDLILNLEEVSEQICAFLNVRFDAAMLNYYKLNQEHQIEPKETMDWKKKTKEKPDASRIGQYKEQLSEKEKSIFLKEAAIELYSYGYE